MIKKGDLYYPTKEFQERAVISDPKIYQKALKDPVKFLGKIGKKNFFFLKK